VIVSQLGYLCLILPRTVVGVGDIINSGCVNTWSQSILVIPVEISAYTITSHPSFVRSYIDMKITKEALF